MNWGSESSAMEQKTMEERLREWRAERARREASKPSKASNRAPFRSVWNTSASPWSAPTAENPETKAAQISQPNNRKPRPHQVSAPRTSSEQRNECDTASVGPSGKADEADGLGSKNGAARVQKVAMCEASVQVELQVRNDDESELASALREVTGLRLANCVLLQQMGELRSRHLRETSASETRHREELEALEEARSDYDEEVKDQISQLQSKMSCALEQSLSRTQALEQEVANLREENAKLRRAEG